MKPLPRKKNIYIALNAAYEHQRGIQRGILRFALAEPTWRLMNVAHEGQLGHEFRRVEEIDGVIGNFSDIDAEGEALRLVRRRGIRSIVSVSARSVETDVPRVIPDDSLVGRQAAEFFLRRRYRHFVYYPGGMDPPHGAAVRRGRAFRERLAQDGFYVPGIDSGNNLRIGARSAEALRGLCLQHPRSAGTAGVSPLARCPRPGGGGASRGGSGPVAATAQPPASLQRGSRPRADRFFGRRIFSSA